MHLCDYTLLMSVLSDYQRGADKMSTSKMLLLCCCCLVVAKAVKSVSSERRVLSNLNTTYVQ